MLLVGIIGGLIETTLAASGNVRLIQCFQRRAEIGFLATLVPIWFVGLFWTSACWSLVASSEPFASDRRAELIRQSIERQEPSAGWHRVVRRISTNGYTLDVVTLINPRNAQAAQPICAAVTEATVADPFDIRKLHLATRGERAVDGELLCGGAADAIISVACFAAVVVRYRWAGPPNNDG